MNEYRLRLTSPETHFEPFPYFIAMHPLGETISSTFLRWLESDAPWKLVETDFYEQYEFSLLDVLLPPAFQFFTERPFLEDLRRSLEQIFYCHLNQRIDCTAHKLIRGQRIRIHNDFIPGGETHRVLIQLNREWQEAQGGVLMLFNSAEASDVHRILPPTNDSAVGFAISDKSHHAVSTIHGGERFTLVFSFHNG